MTHRTSRGMHAALATILLATGNPAAAQEAPPFAELPDSVAERIIAFYNAPGTVRLSGETFVAAGAEIAGPVAVLGGRVTIAGRVQGELVVINGHLTLAPGGIIAGPITVVGGDVTGIDPVAAGARLTHYREPLRFRQSAEGIIYVPEVEAEISAGAEFGFGRTDVLVAVRGAYNRVEGLPVSIGPRIRLGRSNPTLLEALVIYRSAEGLRLDVEDLGYALQAEQYVGGRRTARVGLRAYSEISPVERWGLSDRENSLATFLLHRDYRDAYEREGWAAFVRFAPPGASHDLTVEYRDERHRAVAPESPWSLFDNEEEWRPQPLIPGGRLRSVLARLDYDTRNDESDPSAGWHVRAELEQGLGGNLRQPLTDGFEPGGQPPPDPLSRERFTSALIDVRRYVRLGYETRAAARIVGAGSVDGTALPPQRQQTLGGEGSLPGFPLFAFDCGARDARVEVDGEPFFPFYGCDRLALLQLELQSTFPFARRAGRALGIDVGNAARWVIFFDAGRAWNESNARNGRAGGLSDFSADAGVGVRVGRLGAYWAVPITSGGEGVNFFVRIGRRL
jgi:hypothetical protein